ncbi:MAG: nitroreductase family protein, partial [Chloroflexi bacterium]|nr:nitroreductase family protein [Chloroflexota bacterium]
LGGIARTGRYVAEAPLAIAVAVERTRFAVSDASRAIQSMMLTAWAEGVGSNWIGFVMPAVNDVLGIPAELDVLALVCRSATPGHASAEGRSSASRSATSPRGSATAHRSSDRTELG